LDILNLTDWYGEPGEEAWAIANKYFHVLFFLVHHPKALVSTAKHFKGAIIWRAYGREIDTSYTDVLNWAAKSHGEKLVRKLGRRFWFGQAYDHLHLAEKDVLKDRSVYLPLGLHGCEIEDKWEGKDKAIFFVCPDLGYNQYYQKIFKRFKTDLKGFRYAIGGAQPIKVNDPNVLGFLPLEEHERNMQQFRLMFYHSTEPNHVHYHPFEAIRKGMPLVFMAGGLLDRLGGKKLPGRCKTIAEARKKVSRILNDDWRLIESIRKSQGQLLEPMKVENCVNDWQKGFERILLSLEEQEKSDRKVRKHIPRIAVLIPVGYRGGSLRGAKLLAQAIAEGAKQAGESAEVVLAHLDDKKLYPDKQFSDLSGEITRRPYVWKTLHHDDAQNAMGLAGSSQPLEPCSYIVPDDGINQFLDCDLWIFVSDRLPLHLLPIRPYVLNVFDYLQRYDGSGMNQSFIAAAHRAERVLVTTNFTRKDALQYAGLDEEKVRLVPMLTPFFKKRPLSKSKAYQTPYFIWTTNLAKHKNHENAFKALRIYYDELEGELDCRVTGVDTKMLLSSEATHLKPLADIVNSSEILKSKMHIEGELSDSEYQGLLAGAEFLWHPATIDNGTFSVVEAAHLGVPALSSDYPAMREMDGQFQLNLAWMESSDPDQMAQKIQMIEQQVEKYRESLPTEEMLAVRSLEKSAKSYWKVVRECL
jgi:glycosyltransferase involved in cell wall biosynthesis